MSRNNSTSSLQGFSVFQPVLGSALQWLPALGTHELDELIHTFLPGPASIQDKRAHISMDFFEFSRQTGETFKFYPVYTASFASASTDSPASSSAMHDSGYGSSFNVSPLLSNMSPWTPSLSTSTPASTASDSRTKSRSGPSKRTASTVSGKQLDFSSHPGMRILTKDGRDITHSASRGSKSKEQRDHAHLMRVLKACEACRRKKVRCDPSHKKRTISQPQSSRSASKPATKSKTATFESASHDYSLATPSSLDFTPSFDTAVTPTDSFEGLNHNPDDFWQQFVHMEGPDAAVPGEYDFFLDPEGYVTTSNGSSSVSPALPWSYGVLPEPASTVPALPYLNPGDSYGTNYQDFNLYSPGSEFEQLMDEEPQLVRKPRRKALDSKQDNMLASSSSQGISHPPDIEGSRNPYSGHLDLHGHLPDVNVPDGAFVHAGFSVNGVHDTIAALSHIGDNNGVSLPRQALSQASASSSVTSAMAFGHISTIGLGGTPLLDVGDPVGTRAMPTLYSTASTPPVSPGPLSTFVDGRPDSGRVLDGHGTLPGVSRAGRFSTQARPLPATNQADERRHAPPDGDQSFVPAVEQAASASTMRRALFTRSAFILDSVDLSGIVVDPGRSPLSIIPGSGSHQSDVRTDSNRADGMTVAAGLRQAPHAHYVSSMSTSGVALSDPRAAVVVAGATPPRSSSPQGLYGDLSKIRQSAIPGTDATGLSNLAVFGLLACLLVLFMSCSCLSWQLQLLSVLCLCSSFSRPAHEHTLDSVRSRAMKAFGQLRRPFSALTVPAVVAY